MKKPQDPRKHGLLEPRLIHIEEHFVSIPHGTISRYYYDNISACSLNTALELWEQKRVELAYDNKTVIEGPHITSKGGEMSLTYKTERPNPNYYMEMKTYSSLVKEYDEKLAAYNTFIENKKKGIAEDIDKHILRLEHKIANLKASKDNLPIPFPDD